MVALKGSDIDKFLTRPQRSIVLVFGPDAGLVRERAEALIRICLLYTSPSPRDGLLSRMPSSA